MDRSVLLLEVGEKDGMDANGSHCPCQFADGAAIPRQPFQRAKASHFKLVTTAAGHILIKSGDETTPALIRDNIVKLGFRSGGCEILLNSQAHRRADVQRPLSEGVYPSSFGATKPPRETTGRPRRRSVAALCPCCRDQLNLLGTT